MEWKIYVEGIETDPPKDLSAQFTYTIDDIRDFAARNTNFSKTIVLPGTNVNRRTFGHIFEVGSSSFTSDAAPNVGYNFNASKAANCLITQDGLPIFKGVIRILEIVVNPGDEVEYETAVFGELGGLVAALGEKRIQELDFSQHDHTFTLANIQNSWTAPAGSGYYYGLIDHGLSTDKITFPVENFRPALYAKEYVHKILTGAGYTYESTFLVSDVFKRLIVPFNEEQMLEEVATLVDARLDRAVSFPPGWSTVSFGEGPVTVHSSILKGAYGSFSYIRSEDIRPYFHFEFDFVQNQLTGFAIEVMLNNKTLLHRQDFNASNGHVSIDLSFALQKNDQLTLVLDNFDGDGGGDIETSNLKMRLYGQPSLKVPVGYGDTIRMNSFIPKNIQQKDFLASIIKMFNLFLDESKDRINHLKIEPYGSYYRKTVTKDWSSKLDYNAAYRLKPVAELAARKYEFKYKDDSDFWNDYYKKRFNESYGSRVHDTGNEFVKDKQTLELIFSPTPLVGYEGTDRVLPAIYKRDGITDKPTNFNIRILNRCDQPIACQTWYIKLPNGTSTALTKYPYVGHLDNPDAPTYDINFGSPQEYYFRLVMAYLSANLFNVYWSWYMSEVSDKDSKMLIGRFFLTPEDIAELDFSELIFINGMIYRLHRVIDYTTNGEENTACELLTVIDKD